MIVLLSDCFEKLKINSKVKILYTFPSFNFKKEMTLKVIKKKCNSVKFFALNEKKPFFILFFRYNANVSVVL